MHRRRKSNWGGSRRGPFWPTIVSLRRCSDWWYRHLSRGISIILRQFLRHNPHHAQRDGTCLPASGDAGRTLRRGRGRYRRRTGVDTRLIRFVVAFETLLPPFIRVREGPSWPARHRSAVAQGAHEARLPHRPRFKG